MIQNLSNPIRSFRGWILSWALLLGSLPAISQNINVKGIVRSAAEQGGLPGVNIIVKGSLTGTSTNVSGEYQINAPSNATLVFSGIGFLTQEVALNGKSILDVQLAVDTKQLDEVVVVGYGTQNATRSPTRSLRSAVKK